MFDEQGMKSINALKISAFNDARHLLIANNNHLFLFDMDTLSFRPIKTNVTVVDYGHHFILNNNDVIAFTQHNGMEIFLEHLEWHEEEGGVYLQAAPNSKQVMSDHILPFTQFIPAMSNITSETTPAKDNNENTMSFQ